MLNKTQKYKVRIMLFAVIGASALLSGCVPLLVGGTAAGVATIHDRRTVGTVIDDKTLVLKYESQLHQDKQIAENSHINVSLYNGLVLLTGEAANEQIKSRAEKIIRQNPDIKRVANHIIIGPRSSFANRTYDVKQSAKVKSSLFNVKLPGFDPTRVKVVTEHGVTYLMGLLSEREAEAVVEQVRRISGVRSVVSLFEVY